MSHLSIWPSLIPPPSLSAAGRSNSLPAINPPPQSQAEIGTAQDYFAIPAKRNDSMGSDGSSKAYSVGVEPAALRNSDFAAHRNPRMLNAANVRTRSLGFGAGVVFEREYQEPTDEDVIIVTVRLANRFRKSSVDGADDLPSRPTPRSFLRRLSTRMSSSFDHSAEREERYKAIKMPRGDYKRYFQRDKDGNYAGTEPERDWNEAELMKEFGHYQEMPLHTIPC